MPGRFTGAASKSLHAVHFFAFNLHWPFVYSLTCPQQTLNLTAW